MKHAQGRRAHRTGRYAPCKIYGTVAVMGVALLAGSMVSTGVAWLPAYLLAINAMTFVLFGFDKAIAGARVMRVPERVLYALAIAGASPALLAGQRIFRHKTAKASFQVVFWLIVAAQCALIVYVFTGDVFAHRAQW